MAAGDTVTNAVEPILQTVGTSVTSGLAEPNPVTELWVAVTFLVMVIAIHGWCLGTISGLFSRRFARFTPHTPQWRVSVLTAVTISLLAASHLFETFLWALPIWKMQLIPNLRDTYFFVLETYTTLGDSSISLPHSWRLAGPVIAISGLFTFSWTGSVLVYVMTETGRRHAHQAHAPKPKPAPKET